MLNVATLTLGSWPRPRGCKVAGQKEARESHHILPGSVRKGEGVNPHTPKATPTLGDGVPVDSQNFREQFDSMAWRVLYIIGKLLKRRCLKWALIAHLDIWNTSYGKKKGRESNCQFDSWPEKVGNWPDLLSFRQRATYRWKDFDEGYNFFLDFISIQGLHAKLWRPKVARVPTLAISRLSLGSPETKSHLDVGPVKRCRVYYKGEGGGFPPSPGRGESCVSVLLVGRPSTKGAPTMH